MIGFGNPSKAGYYACKKEQINLFYLLHSARNIIYSNGFGIFSGIWGIATKNRGGSGGETG